MPDLYARGDYDLAGFCVGVVERKRVIDGRAIAPGDVVLGLASSGLHSNGYSLVRKVVFDIAGLGGRAITSTSWARPSARRCSGRRGFTCRPMRKVLSYYKVKERGTRHRPHHRAAACAKISTHLARGSAAVIDRDGWTVPPVFPWLQRLGEIDADEMDTVFNMGVGMVLVVSPYYVDSIAQQLKDEGLECCTIGHIASGERAPCGRKRHLRATAEDIEPRKHASAQRLGPWFGRILRGTRLARAFPTAGLACSRCSARSARSAAQPEKMASTGMDWPPLIVSSS